MKDKPIYVAFANKNTLKLSSSMIIHRSWEETETKD